MMKASICLFAVLVVALSKSDLLTGETKVNAPVTSIDNDSSVPTHCDGTLIKEILLKQDMSQALLLTNFNVLQVMTDVQRLKEEIRHLNKENVDLRNQLTPLLNKSKCL